MHYDVTSCVICISNNVEYFEKEWTYKNSTKEVALSFQMILGAGYMEKFQPGLGSYFKTHFVFLIQIILLFSIR